MKKEISCGAVISKPDENKLLVIKHSNGGHWGFPKGHVENNETEEETAKREILEETGIHAEIDTGFRYVVTYLPKPGVTKDVVYFAAKALDINTTPQQAEVTDIKWMTPEEAEKTFTFKDYKDVLRAYLEYTRYKK